MNSFSYNAAVQKSEMGFTGLKSNIIRLAFLSGGSNNE